jgi:CheY-like chemotaxis protein
MKDKYCIIIDDESQDEIVENLKADARQRGVDLTCFQLNPQGDDCHKNVGDDKRPNFVIDMEKVVAKLRSAEYRKLKVNVIACDYNLQDDEVDGFEIIRKIRNDLNYKKEIILYSANIDIVIRRILQLDDVGKRVQSIRNLARANIREFSDKNDYRGIIVSLIRQDAFSLESEIESLLNRYSELTFKSGFPPLSGKKLSEILEEIDSGTVLGEKFQSAILENAIAHMIDLNREIDE